MSDKILRGEVFCRLKTIEKHFKKLQNQQYPTDGPAQLLKLCIKIIERICSRFAIYNSMQVKHIAVLCCNFEVICGYINDSRMANVPWSILPALDILFQDLDKNSEYTICPMWESNYGVLTGDAISFLKEICRSGNLIFNAPSSADLDSQISSLFSGAPERIHFLFYPRLERLSAVHFALLGHEIGHIFAEEWTAAKFAAFETTHKLTAAFEKIAKQEYAASFKGVPPGLPDVFEANFVLLKTAQAIEMCKKALREIISDIYGAFVFGDIALVAKYLFFLRSDIDDVSNWWKHSAAYPSPRYRIKIVSEAIKHLKAKYNFSGEIVCGWEDRINECISAPIAESKCDEYVRAFIKKIDYFKHYVFDQIENKLDPNVFTRHVEKQMISVAEDRLKKQITPNAFVSADGKETPIDFRNILYSATLRLADLSADLLEYENHSKIVNLLSIKGIELSTEHERFQQI
jgi:hypothetical protein